MPISIHIPSDQSIQPYSAQFKSIAESTITAVKKFLLIENVDIFFEENPNATIDEIGGIGGFTPNADKIYISLNPSHPDFKKAIEKEFFFTLAHELHHTIRWQKEVEGDTLLEALVFEGLADHFAQEVTGRTKPSVYSDALNPDQKKMFLEKAEKEWLLPTYDNSLWFFGSSPDIIPRWTGYTLGYDLVEKYLSIHKESSASTLAIADATIFI